MKTLLKLFVDNIHLVYKVFWVIVILLVIVNFSNIISSLNPFHKINSSTQVSGYKVFEYSSPIEIDTTEERNIVDLIAWRNFKYYDIYYPDFKFINRWVEPFDTVAKMPEFIGGYDALLKYFNANIKIDKKDVSCIILTAFIVEKDGSISNIKISNGVCKKYNREVLQVIQSMPKWKAGCKNGKSVRVKYRLPVVFTEDILLD